MDPLAVLAYGAEKAPPLIGIGDQSSDWAIAKSKRKIMTSLFWLLFVSVWISNSAKPL